MLQQLLIIVASCMFCINAKLCQDVNVRNGVSFIEENLRGCTVIAGNLEIVLVEKESMDEYANISFPELTEIRGYFLMFRVQGLTTLSQLFPNLTIIRGLNLFRGYSFILYELMHLEEIGLYNLKYILRGGIRVEHCPHLCHVSTINWTLIGTSPKLNYFNDVNEDHCEPCSKNCEGFCWNNFHCQHTASDDCHPECLGCTEPNSPDKCIECRTYRDDETCVSECSKEKVRHPMLASCLTDCDCYYNPLHGKWLPFQGDCIQNCPERHVKVKRKDRLVCEYAYKTCSGIEVNSTNSALHLRGCTHINESLIIRFDSIKEVDELHKNLDMIEEIDNFLQIHRSSALTSLEFLKRLRIIHGKKLYKNRHALVAFKNENLYKLWERNHTIEIKRGTIFFHDNFELCLSTINKFAKKAKLNYTEFDVSPLSNGDNRTCNYIDLDVKIVNSNCTNVTLLWENVTATRNLSAPIGYLLFYTEDASRNFTIYDKYDEHYDNRWETIFVADNNTHQIVNLNPFTQYAYYFKLYTNSTKTNGLTKIRYFSTLSDDPTELNHFDAISTASDSVNLNWEYPAFPNGVPGHYELVVYFERDDEVFIAQRNFCKHPHYGYDDISDVANATSETCCKNQLYQIPSKKFEFTCDRLNIIMNADPKPGGCKNYMYSIEDHNTTIGSNDSNVDFVPVKPISAHKIVKRSIFPTNSSYIMEVPIENPNITTYTVKQLKYFSMFVFLLKICHKDTRTQCSSPVMAFQRTLPKEDADDIPPGLSVHVENSDVVIAWSEPREPNSMIVSYQVEHKRTDLNSSKPLTTCITREEFIEFNHKFKIKQLASGQYAVKVQAISLAGPGKFSEYVTFQISKPSSPSIAIVIGAIIVVISISIGVVYCYRYYYKKRLSMDHETLISSVPSYYSGPSYVEDEWEIDREDVEIYSRIAQGSFISVCTGLIKSQNRPCAVKSTTLTDFHDKISFLNETSTLKWFSTAHHVVKLLGVVSKGQQPLVLMELLSKGDLKSYLRKLRLSSVNITPTEMYRMAAEIADGMAYLSSQRFVHRDLAARNCMVSGDGTVKIGDYGISKDTYQEDYCRKETGNLVPVRWMAPESLLDASFTTDSDTWSYGVLLWEIVTFASQPYETLSNEAVSEFVINQGTLQRPSECPDLLYEIMKLCWEWRPNDRPLFVDIIGRLEWHVEQQFSFVSFYDSPEGEKYRRSGKLRAYNAPALSTPFSRNLSVRWNALDDNIDI